MSMRMTERRTAIVAGRRRSRIRRILVALLCASGMLGVTNPSSAQELIRRFSPVGLGPTTHPGLSAGSAFVHPELRAGAEANHSWEALVGRVTPGRKVKVTLNDSTVTQGELLAIDSQSITVRQAGAPRTITATDIRRVGYATHRSRNAFLLALAAGGGLAWALDRTSSHPSSVAEDMEMGMFFLGLPTGGVAAVVMHDRPLYQARSLPRTP